MSVRDENDLKGLRRVGKFVSDTLHAMKRRARPGMSTRELDEIAAGLFRARGARSAPGLTYNFPGHTCICVNDQVAHGIPTDDTVLREGDLVNIDVSAELDGFFADTGHSFQIPPFTEPVQRLCRSCLDVQSAVIAQIRSGIKINQIGRMINREARQRGFTVIKNLASHGTGRALHEYPEDILNYQDHTDRRLLNEGQVITIEPFLSTGDELVVTGPDGWTLHTPNRSLTAQHEHTLVVTRGAPVLVTYLN